MGAAARRAATALRAARRACRARPVARGHRRQPRRLHPVHALPARLPRRAGQRRHRPGVPWRARADRLRRRRPDGPLELRRLRRMRAGLSDRCADAGARCRRWRRSRRQVDSVCPYCGVGCQLTWHVKDDKILYVTGRDGPANHGRLCVKGRYGFDYVHHPQRLTMPLIRREGVPKTRRRRAGPGDRCDCSARRAGTRRSTLRRRPARNPRRAAAGGAGRLRLGQGQQRRGLPVPEAGAPGDGSSHVDHCTRLCHASSVAALLEGIGSGAVSNPVRTWR